VGFCMAKYTPTEMLMIHSLSGPSTALRTEYGMSSRSSNLYQ